MFKHCLELYWSGSCLCPCNKTWNLYVCGIYICESGITIWGHFAILSHCILLLPLICVLMMAFPSFSPVTQHYLVFTLLKWTPFDPLFQSDRCIEHDLVKSVSSIKSAPYRSRETFKYCRIQGIIPHYPLWLLGVFPNIKHRLVVHIWGNYSTPHDILSAGLEG